METIYIKNMVCDRCIASVRKIFEAKDIQPIEVSLGEVIYNEIIPNSVLAKIEDELKLQGFQLIEGDTPVLVTKIKSAIINLFNQNEIAESFKLSSFLTSKFPYDYSHISRIFSNHEKDTIEHFLIKVRIEKAKELLTYKDHNVSEVAYKLGYVSASHFSRQFKNLVGMAPSAYQNNPSGRKSLHDI
ncbi:MAG: AraC family transcriptional regulator [Bacteroidia bacterium]|nr:AraC family transcriptional regulator [Bacteroidia bacterium]